MHQGPTLPMQLWCDNQPCYKRKSLKVIEAQQKHHLCMSVVFLIEAGIFLLFWHGAVLRI